MGDSLKNVFKGMVDRHLGDTIRCPECNALLIMVGRVHRCVPSRHITPTIDPSRNSDHPAIVKQGRPRLEVADRTTEAQKPWVAAGMSRATWYRRKAEKV